MSIRQLLLKNDVIIAPGAFDGLSARLVEQAGFPAIYASGGAIARSAGFPDIGLMSFSEVLQRLEHMVEVTTSPIIADADTGFGNEVNVKRTIKAYQRLGISACHIEDQTFPKRCGHLDDKHLIPTNEMCIKIQAAKEVAASDFILIARTDAIAVEGFNAALDRANAYASAGADVIFIEAPSSLQQIEDIAKYIKTPKLINMFQGGKTPIVPTERLKELGYRIVIIPSDLQRAAIKAMQTTLAAIREDGDSHKVQEWLTSFSERETIIGTQTYLSS